MPGAVRDRLALLRAAIRGDPGMRRVPVRDSMRGALAWYGIERSRVARRVRVRPATAGFHWVDVGPYELAWPEASPLDRLYVALVELWTRSNPHYYFRLPTAVRPGDHVLDVGACEGAFALECVIRYGAAQVSCFEPSPIMAAALRLTVERNNLNDHIRVVEASVSSTAGERVLMEDARDPLVARLDAASHPSSAGGMRSVQCVALDGWARDAGVARIDYLKVDAEGSDLRVLEGARGLIAACRPRIAITTYHLASHSEDMIALLGELDRTYACSVRGAVAYGGVARPVMLHASSTMSQQRTTER